MPVASTQDTEEYDRCKKTTEAILLPTKVACQSAVSEDKSSSCAKARKKITPCFFQAKIRSQSQKPLGEEREGRSELQQSISATFMGHPTFHY